MKSFKRGVGSATVFFIFVWNLQPMNLHRSFMIMTFTVFLTTYWNKYNWGLIPLLTR